MAQLTKGTTYTVNSEVNSTNLNALVDSSTISNIVNADIDASAAIVDTKLAAISTAGKVSGAALTGLSAIPSGAGIIPSANLPTASMGLVSATSFSSATNSGNITISSTAWYQVRVLITLKSAATETINLRFNNDTGANYIYIVRGFVWDSTPTASNALSLTGTSIVMTPALQATASVNAWVNFVIPPQATGGTKTIFVKGDSANNQSYNDFAASWGGTATVTSFRILTSGSETISGTVYLYSNALS